MLLLCSTLMKHLKSFPVPFFLNDIVCQSNSIKISQVIFSRKELRLYQRMTYLRSFIHQGCNILQLGFSVTYFILFFTGIFTGP